MGCCWVNDLFTTSDAQYMENSMKHTDTWMVSYITLINKFVVEGTLTPYTTQETNLFNSNSPVSYKILA